MKFYHLSLIGTLLNLSLIAFVYFSISSMDVSDCSIYLKHEWWSFTTKQMEELAYQECLNDTLDERNQAKDFAMIVVIGAMMPSTIYMAYKAHKSWKESLKSVKGRWKN